MKKRAPKKETPEDKKTDKWKAQRKRNTLAARLYRQKQRQYRQEMKTRLENAKKKNKKLKKEVEELMTCRDDLRKKSWEILYSTT